MNAFPIPPLCSDIHSTWLTNSHGHDIVHSWFNTRCFSKFFQHAIISRRTGCMLYVFIYGLQPRRNSIYKIFEFILHLVKVSPMILTKDIEASSFSSPWLVMRYIQAPIYLCGLTSLSIAMSRAMLVEAGLRPALQKEHVLKFWPSDQSWRIIWESYATTYRVMLYSTKT